MKTSKQRAGGVSKKRQLAPQRTACTWPGCDRVFAKKANMKAHMSIHTGEKPFMCHFPGCNKRFRLKTSLNYHFQSKRSGHGSDVPVENNVSIDGISFVEQAKATPQHNFNPIDEAEERERSTAGPPLRLFPTLADTITAMMDPNNPFSYCGSS